MRTRFHSLRLFALLGLALTAPAQAFLSHFRVPPIADWVRQVRFTVPNELNPERAVPLYSTLSPGVCLSVGFERSFLLYALAGAACTHLVIIDDDPFIIRESEINLALLRSASSLENYRALRLVASLDEWRGIGLSREDYYWWRAVVREEKGMGRMHDPSDPKFIASNYLYNETLFARLQQAAIDRRMRAFGINLKDVQKLSQLGRALQDEDLNLSLIDLSNVWWKGFVGPAGIEASLSAFGDAVRQDTLILFSGREASLEASGTGYFGYRHDFIQRHRLPTLLEGAVVRTRIGESLKPGVLGTLNGLPVDAFGCGQQVVREAI